MVNETTIKKRYKNQEFTLVIISVFKKVGIQNNGTNNEKRKV